MGLAMAGYGIGTRYEHRYGLDWIGLDRQLLDGMAYAAWV